MRRQPAAPLPFTYRLYGLLAHRLQGFMAVRAAIGETFAFHADVMPEKVALLYEKSVKRLPLIPIDVRAGKPVGAANESVASG
jgi:hypothetical protein